MSKRKFGLVGFPLSHSFSKGYFMEKFLQEGIKNCSYENFEIKDITTFPSIVAENNELKGMNVTIPHKQAVIPFLDDLHPAAERIGAVNVIAVSDNKKLTGYNTDYFGFKGSLEKLLDGDTKLKALVLGTGGASKAVLAALEDLFIPYQKVSRKASQETITYADVTEQTIKDYRLIVNTTPLGMTPKIDACPNILYSALTSSHYLFDIVYNPEETLFLTKGKQYGAKIVNGLEMLHIQAEKAWEIWNV